VPPIEITVNADDFFGIVDALEGYPRRQVEQIALVFQELGAQLGPVLQANTPIGASGDLARSTRSVVHILNDVVQLDVIQPAISQDGEFYQDFVATGRAPGKRPPAEALAGWIELKWGSTDPADSYRLAAHIGAHGTQPNDYVFRTLEQGKEAIDDAARRLGIDLTIALWEDYSPNIITP
jgi:hypothetical protein